ncbi:MAG: tetratricopeptide repeat protein [Proteobacteria bacterium]|nr:tetratricopeptide repeat protein [Pseudomonadota bacterium]
MIKRFIFWQTLVFIILIFTGSAVAEIKTFTHTVKQPFGGSQSPDDARVAAMVKAKREVLEMAGTYLESFTIVKENVVKKDEILALAAGVLKARIVSQENYASKDGFGIIIKAKVDVDTSVLEDRIRKLLQDRSLLEKYKESKRREKELLVRIKKLEKKNRKLQKSVSTTHTQEKENLKKEFKKATQELTATEWNDKALALVKDSKWTDPDRVIRYLNQAIKLDPNFAVAYYNRGTAWGRKGEYDIAIRNFNKAIELNSQLTGAYYNRGKAWAEKGEHDRAIKDYSRAIELNPRDGKAYYNRGVAYTKLGQNGKAASNLNDYLRIRGNRDGKASLVRQVIRELGYAPKY